MRKIGILCLISLFALQGCLFIPDFDEPYRNTHWKIESYTINGADSMKSINEFNLDGKINLSQSNSDYWNLYVTTDEGQHDGEWSLSRKKFYFLLYGFRPYKITNPPKDWFNYTSKISFKPFTTIWDVENISEKEIKLKLTSDNKKYTLKLYKL